MLKTIVASHNTVCQFKQIKVSLIQTTLPISLRTEELLLTSDLYSNIYFPHITTSVISSLSSQCKMDTKYFFGYWINWILLPLINYINTNVKSSVLRNCGLII